MFTQLRVQLYYCRTFPFTRIRLQLIRLHEARSRKRQFLKHKTDDTSRTFHRGTCIFTQRWMAIDILHMFYALPATPPPSPCEPENPCQNGGTCHGNGNGGHTCDCPEGYTGDDCEIRELLLLFTTLWNSCGRDFFKKLHAFDLIFDAHTEALQDNGERAYMFILKHKSKSAEQCDGMGKA